jgi:hypothetical protein
MARLQSFIISKPFARPFAAYPWQPGRGQLSSISRSFSFIMEILSPSFDLDIRAN